MRRRPADRRGRPRFDIVGDLSGTLEAVVRLPMKNVGPQGALIHSPVLLAADSVHRVIFVADGQEVATEVRVRHVQARVSADGERMYLIGVEFLSMHPTFLKRIQQWAADGNGEVAVET